MTASEILTNVAGKIKDSELRIAVLTIIPAALARGAEYALGLADLLLTNASAAYPEVISLMSNAQLTDEARADAQAGHDVAASNADNKKLQEATLSSVGGILLTILMSL